MFARLILVCYIFIQVNGDVESDLKVEEETRHNQTASSFKIGWPLNFLPKVTDQERAEADKILADIYPLGDPERPLADTEEKIEANLCRNHKERGVQFLAYARKRWPTHLILQVAVRISLHAIGNKNDWYCRDAGNRKIYTSNATVINTFVNELNVARNKFIDDTMVLVYGNTSLHKLTIVCCSFWRFKAQSINVIKVNETKHFITDYIIGYSGPTLKYLCVYHSEGSKACDNLVIPPPPINYPRFTSLYGAGVHTISKLTSISAK